MKDGEYAQFIQVNNAVLAVDKISDIQLSHEVKYESGRVMTPARIFITMTNGNGYELKSDSEEGQAFSEWRLSRTHVLVPMKPEEQEAS